MEKGEFEKRWSDAFEGAEVSPADAVWTNVELDLERAAGGKMKKRILFYKMLAAASLVFAMGVAGVYYLQGTPETNDTLAQKNASGLENSETSAAGNEVGNKTETSTESLASSNSSSRPDDNLQASNSSVIAIEPNRAAREKSGLNNTNNLQTKTMDSSPSNETVDQKLLAINDKSEQVSDQLIVKNTEAMVSERNNNTLTYRKLPPITSLKNPELIIAKKESESTADPGMVLLAKLKDEEKKYAEEDNKKKSKQEELWTSVAFGAGTFNPNSGNGTMIQSNSFSGSSNSFTSNPSSGSSYSFGVQVGGKITNRLVLQGGVSYLAQNASYMSNIASMESASLRASLNDFASSSNYQAITTSPYTVNSNLQYISVPTQLGYVLVDRKFAIQVNGGVATDIFIVNTLTPETDNVSKVSQGPGEDSPYRPVLFSGLVGTEFSYRFSDRYRIAVNPGFRYALNSMYKAEVSAEASPITYDVALRFRYIFK
ncbi:MAG: hypothetical protein KF803_08395 [Cyclobacteriaceae bacterium]|nr:hypothetical protein [Cyclobacteriaceae bacterium]